MLYRSRPFPWETLPKAAEMSSHSLRATGIFVLGLLPFLFFSCGLFDDPGDGAALTVGSREVSIHDLKGALDFIGVGGDVWKHQDDRARDRLIQQVVDHYLLLEYGRQKGISVSEAEFYEALGRIREGYSEKAFDEALLRGYVGRREWEDRLREQLLVKKIVQQVAEEVIEPPSSEEMREYFEKNREQFAAPPLVRFSQIVTRKRQEAQELLERIRGGEDMEELAREYSVAPEAEAGGEAGWVAQGRLDESMDKVLFSMSPGETSPVVETPYGYHIFRVLEARSGGTKELKEVVDEIESKLMAERKRKFFEKWIEDLRTKFEVEINRKLLEKLELN